MLRKKGAGDHALYHLKDDSEDAEKLEQVVGEAEVNARIVELLGLDFDAFGRSVLLAQGRFAEFLTARPAPFLRNIRCASHRSPPPSARAPKR